MTTDYSPDALRYRVALPLDTDSLNYDLGFALVKFRALFMANLTEATGETAAHDDIAVELTPTDETPRGLMAVMYLRPLGTVYETNWLDG